MIFRTSVFGVMALSIVAGCTVWQPNVAGSLHAQPYACSQASGSILIDGKLDEPAWKQAEVIDTFYPFSPKDAAHLSATTVRLLWDASNLYVAFECKDDDVWSYSDKPDTNIWRGDTAELFIKPKRDALDYYEMDIAPNGALYDAHYPSRGAGFYRCTGWSSGARIATEVNGTDGDLSDTDVGYAIEMAIPLSAFQGAPLPAEGVVWGFGAFRYNFSKSLDHPLLLMSIPEALHDGFHYYEGYHDLVFAGIPERPLGVNKEKKNQ